MNNAIETTRHAMYECLEVLRAFKDRPTLLGYFETHLELHLEELRKQLKTANEDTQGANILKDEFQQRLMRMTEERDQIQGRLHAIDEAYDKSQRALGVSGEEIRRLQALLQLRGACAGTYAQDSQENVSSDDTQANALMIVLGALVDAQRIVTDWLVPDGIKAKKAMSKLVPVLDNETLFLAMRTFEKTAPKDDAMLKECAHSYSNRHGCPDCGKKWESSFAYFAPCNHRWGPSNSSVCTLCGAPCPM